MSRKSQEIRDYIILGAGPAGLQLAYYFEREGLDYVVLEGSATAGSFFRSFPRHRTLLSINKVHTGRDDHEFNLRHDWNSLLCDREDFALSNFTKEYFPSADALVDYLEAFAEQSEAKISYNTRIDRISRDEQGMFSLLDTAGEVHKCRRLIVATGISKPYIPDIPGIELVTGYEHMSLEASDYRNKSVLILGKANSALETANHLVPEAAVIHVLSPTPVALAWQTRHVGHVRAINNNFLDTYHLKSQNAAIDGVIRNIHKDEAGKFVVNFSSIHVADEVEEITYDEVIRCTGFRFDNSLFDDSCQPALRSCGRLPAMGGANFESTNIEGLFFAGATMQSLDYKKGQSAFIHGFRYNVRTLSSMLLQRYHGQDLPSFEIDTSKTTVGRAVLERMSRISSLWQQVGVLCDLLIYPDDPAEPVRCIIDLMYDQAREEALRWREDGNCYIAWYRFGECNHNPFDHPRSANIYEGETSTASHPVIEHWNQGQLVDQFHVLEDFAADWTGDEYIESLDRYLETSRRGEQFVGPSGAVERIITRTSDMRLAR